MKITGQGYSRDVREKRKKQKNFESWKINGQVSRLKKLNPKLMVQKVKKSWLRLCDP